MKKLFLLFAIIALTGINQTFSQDVKFGVKAGVNFSDITGEEVDSFDGLTCFHFGLVAEILFSDTFAIQPELLYSRQGSKYEEDYGEGYDIEGTVKVDYINIPIMAKYFVAEGFSIEAGPQIGFLRSAKDEYEDDEEDIKEYLKGTDFGVNFGLGYKLENGLNFAARYNIGLSDNLDTDEFEAEGAEYKNSVIQLSIGYFF